MEISLLPTLDRKFPNVDRIVIMQCTKIGLEIVAMQHKSTGMIDFPKACGSEKTLMKNKGIDRFVIRKLGMGDFAQFRAHLKRLDRDTQRLRFGHHVSEDFIDAYVDTSYRIGTLVFAAFEGGEIRASAELRGLAGVEFDAEAAFAVEAGWQDRGLGSELMARIITAAQNRGFGRLHMICLRENARMRHIAGKYGAQLKFMGGDVLGELDPHHPTPVSVLDEMIHDAQGFVTAVLDWQR